MARKGKKGQNSALKGQKTRRELSSLAVSSGAVSVPALAELYGCHFNSIHQQRRAHPQWGASLMETLAQNKDAAKGRKHHKATTQKPLPSAGDIDFLAFREQYLKRRNFWFHDDAYRRIETSERLIMLVPPEHAKTTVWSIEYPVYKLMMDRNLRVTVVQKSQVEAKKVIRQVQSRMSDHAFYSHLEIPEEEDALTVFGGKDGFKPARADGLSWGAESFYLLGVDSGEKDPSMQAKGTTSTILGNRIDLLILDDIQDTRSYTPEMTETLMNLLRHDWISRMGKHGKIIMLGSRLGPGDIYERVMDEMGETDDRDYGWPIVKYPAVLNEVTKELLAPDLWDWPSLQRKKFEAGEKWWTNWMMADVDPEGVTFQRELLKQACDIERAIGEVPSQVSQVFIGVDPAIRGYCAMVVWGLDKSTGVRYLLDVSNEKGMGDWDNVTARAKSLAATYGARRVVVETNNTQGDVYERIAKAITEVGARAVPYQTVTATGARAQETEFDISTVAALYQQGLVSLPYGDQPTREKVDAFIVQCCNWRAGVRHLVKDMVMANLFAESEARAEMRRGTGTFRKPSRAPRWAYGEGNRWPWARPRQQVKAS
mgnify:FL=1